MQQINKDVLKALGPCANSYKNFLQHYSEFNGTLVEFLNLSEITYDDKIWVAQRLITKNQAVRWAIYTSESVLPLWQARYPEDGRVEACHLATRAYVESPTESNLSILQEARQRARSAYAANAAAYAANAAAYATYATYAAAYATYAANAAASAAYATADAYDDAARKTQQEKNIQLLIKSIKETE